MQASLFSGWGVREASSEWVMFPSAREPEIPDQAPVQHAASQLRHAVWSLSSGTCRGSSLSSDLDAGSSVCTWGHWPPCQPAPRVPLGHSTLLSSVGPGFLAARPGPCCLLFLGSLSHSLLAWVAGHLLVAGAAMLRAPSPPHPSPGPVRGRHGSVLQVHVPSDSDTQTLCPRTPTQPLEEHVLSPPVKPSVPPSQHPGCVFILSV